MVEQLENRRMLAAAINALGQVQIDGTEGADVAEVTETKGQILVELNEDFYKFDKADVTNGIYFEGKAGNDRFFNYTGLKSIAYGGSGDDHLEGGSDWDRFWGGDGLDKLIGHDGNDDLRGGKGPDVIFGMDGDDRLMGEAGDDDLIGGEGDDRLYGGSGDDWLSGGAGDDNLKGQSGDDDVFGKDGNDYIYGGSGDDNLHGEDGVDVIYGGKGNDSLWGGNHPDALYGESGHDNIYGEGGNDVLDGGSGRDGLVPGYGMDTVTPGTGADRILRLYAMPIVVSNDTIIGLNSSQDAIINFTNGDTWWDHTELEKVDEGLAKLHHHPLTQSTDLLKLYNGSSLVFLRESVVDLDDIPPGYPPGAAAMSGQGSLITFFDSSMVNSVDTDSIVIHEIGHKWQTSSANPFALAFRAVSGWTKTPVPWLPQFPAQGGWYYTHFNSFVSNYARTNPLEDFAETFEYYFVVGANHANPFVQAKLDYIEDLLNSL